MDAMGDSERAYFLERLVHDLREPLRSVHSFSELLGAERSPDDERILSEIVAGIHKLRTLVDGVSEYAAALRSGDGPPASLQLAFDMALLTLDGQIRNCGATVTGQDLPLVAVKLERLTQLIENLVANSLLFRSEAPPAVQVTARGQDTGWWLIQVRDNGIGMEPGLCESAFKPFTRLNGRKYPGAGLGLTICKTIVEAHGGTIRMESEPGKGSTCHLTLPVA